MTKMPFKITDSCVDRVKVNDKQGLGGLSIHWWFTIAITVITSGSTVTP